MKTYKITLFDETFDDNFTESWIIWAYKRKNRISDALINWDQKRMLRITDNEGNSYGVYEGEQLIKTEEH